MTDINTCVYTIDMYLETEEEKTRPVLAVDLLEILERHFKIWIDTDITVPDAVLIIKFLIDEYLLSVRQEESLDDFLASLNDGAIALSFNNYATRHNISLETAGYGNAYEFMQDYLESNYYGSLITNLGNILSQYGHGILGAVPVKWDIRFNTKEVHRFILWARVKDK